MGNTEVRRCFIVCHVRCQMMNACERLACCRLEAHADLWLDIFSDLPSPSENHARSCCPSTFKSTSANQHHCKSWPASPSTERQNWCSWIAMWRPTPILSSCRGIWCPSWSKSSMDQSPASSKMTTPHPHRAAAVKLVKQQLQLRTLRWPSRSPDMNPNEHVWSHVKNLTELREAMVNCWR